MAIREVGKGISAQATHNSEEAQENEAEHLRLNDVVATFQDVKTKLESDKSDLLTKRSQLLTTLAAQYPEQPWSSLWPTPSETNKSDLAH